jgi:chromosomal replication initiation ATPase DnaA
MDGLAGALARENPAAQEARLRRARIGRERRALEREKREREARRIADEDRARVGFVIALAAFALGVTITEVRHVTRGCAEAALARQVAMYIAHVAFEMSLARVANAFRRDRSTVAHACHRMEDRRDEPGFDKWLDQLEATARAAPSPLPDALATELSALLAMELRP